MLSTDYQKYEKEEGPSKKLEGGLRDLNHIIMFVLQCRIMSTAGKKKQAEYRTESERCNSDCSN